MHDNLFSINELQSTMEEYFIDILDNTDGFEKISIDILDSKRQPYAGDIDRNNQGQPPTIASVKKRVMHSVTAQNLLVLEPMYQVDVSVTEPELKDNEIYSSQSAFMNVVDGFDEIINNKMKEAKVGHFDKKTHYAEDLSASKNLLLLKHVSKNGDTIIILIKIITIIIIVIVSVPNDVDDASETYCW